MKRRASTHNPLPQALDALFEVLLAEPDADARAAAHDAWHVTVDARNLRKGLPPSKTIWIIIYRRCLMMVYIMPMDRSR